MLKSKAFSTFAFGDMFHEQYYKQHCMSGAVNVAVKEQVLFGLHIVAYTNTITVFGDIQQAVGEAHKRIDVR